MIAATAISAAPPDDPVLDWSALVNEGRSCLEGLSGSGWTDFNAHDPGITILELVAYALTDLGYRSAHSIADLMAGSAPLPGPARSLTTRAVTLADMRRAGLDVAGVRNVWIEPSAAAGLKLRFTEGSGDLEFEETHSGDSGKLELRGVHRVLIEKSSREDLAGADLARAVALRLHSERGLGEDFESFTVLDPHAVVVAADLEIDDPARAESILLDVYSKLEAYMSPQVARSSVSGLRLAGLASDEIYDGPLLERGVVADAAASEARRTILHLSDVVAILASVSGVRTTRRVRLGASLDDALGAPTAWSLPIDDGQVSVFDVQSSRIRLMSAGAIALDSSARPDLAATFASRSRDRAASDVAAMDDDPLPLGRDRNLMEYRPLRYDLPLAYGVQPGSLEPAAPPPRRAAANQLRAYLAIIDSLIANLFAQLSGAKDLLSPAPARRQSYFAQAAEPASSEAPILSAGFDQDALQDLVEPPGGASATSRRNRFLAHLLARFGETVPAVPRPVAGALDGTGEDEDHRLLDCREAFLGSISELGSGRGSGANLLVDGDEPPLLDRIRLKLGLPPAARDRLLLVEHVLLRGVADDVPAALPLLSAAARPDPYSLQVSFILDERLRSEPGDEDRIAQVIREECPAHLVGYLHWLSKDDFDTFAKGHGQWLSALRSHRRELLGFAEP